MSNYMTVCSAEPTEIEVKRSRFICHVKNVTSRAEADAFVALVRTQHREASHNVFAYIVRENNYCRFSDDGEPSGTAGKPVLDVLRGSGLVDACVVVTRYFGGTLLGTGGLVRAYGDAARIGLETAEKIKMVETALFTCRFDYTYYGKISALVSDFGGKVEQNTFDDAVNLEFYIPNEQKNSFLSALTEATLGKVSANFLSFCYKSEKI